MKAQKKRLIVVLGMHRSGTSAIARGLRVLGVSLGDKLMPPNELDNPTGYWEDLDIYALNIEMLRALGSDWDRMSPLDGAEVESLRKSGFFLRGAQLMRAKLAERQRFGFKDPRLAKLLPFWKRVFAHCRFDASYVLSLRHPTSVARSLEKRNGFETGKSYLLWLDHVLESLAGTRGCRRVLVDYDRLMQDAGGELRRMAKALGLGVHTAALAAYKSTFLDAALRHSEFGAEDLALDDACPPLVREVHAALQDAAADRTSLESAEFREALSGWLRERERLWPMLALADRLSSEKNTASRALAEREGSYRAHVAQLEKAVGDRDLQAEHGRQAAAEREAAYRAHVAELEKAVGERDEQAERARQSAAERETAYRAHVAELEKAVGERDQRVAGLEQLSAERAQRVAGLEPAVAERDRQIAQLAEVMAARETGHRQQVAALEQAARERDQRIAGLEQRAAQRDEQLAKLASDMAARETGHRQQVAALEQAARERDQRIAALGQRAAELDRQLAKLAAEMAERESGYRQHVADLERAVDARDAQLAGLKDEATGQKAQLRYLEGSFAVRGSQIEYIERSLAAREQQLAALRQAAEERDQRQRAHVTELEKAVGDREQQVAARDQAMAQREAGYTHHVSDLEKAVFAEHQRRILETVELQRQLKELRSSVYWQMTYPLRALDRLGGKLLRALRGGSRAASSAGAAKPEPAALPAAAPGPAAEPQRLPAADGTWEWADLPIVKARIESAKAERRGAFMPVPVAMIELGDEPPADAARRIALPDPGDAPEVSIVIPVFNQLKLTLECLLSIAERTGTSVRYEVIVADDASTDATADVLGAIRHLRLTRSAANLGFLRNCNRALEQVRGRYVLLLNNDVQVTQGWLQGLLATFAQFPRAGAAGPRILYPGGWLQEAGAALRPDGTPVMVGLNEDPAQPRYAYARRVDYVSGACLMAPAALLRELGGFADEYAPCYCEDSDLCLRIEQAGYDVYYNPAATIVHHLSRSTAAIDDGYKLRCVAANLATLSRNWAPRFAQAANPRVLAFYLPQFHPIPENSRWWGEGFTEWTNVSKAKPNFAGHDMPRQPADLGYYDLRLPEVMAQQAELARRYGIHGFCFYYYWFAGKRLLEAPLEQMLASGKPDFPFCLCWANENWTRRWDGEDQEILMAQSHSPEDDLAAIADLARHFRDPRYIRVDGRPLILVYRVTRFPDFAATAARWRAWCREHGIGEIYIALVESFELVHAGTRPAVYGCDAAVEFPPQELAEPKPPSGAVTNPAFEGRVADYRDLAVRFATRPQPAYTRFMGVATGWDNTPRSQNRSYCFEHATPGAFQAWLAEAVEQTRLQHHGDERLIFVNAWNEWAECAYLEPDRRFGHAYLEAVRNALDGWLLR